MRGRHASRSRNPNLHAFQSTPPCGGDAFSQNLAEALRYFNPRPLAGATIMLPGGSSGFLFQSTPPCGGDSGSSACPASRQNFNPRPLAGATSGCGGSAVKGAISIHAPLRGRLHRGAACRFCSSISIHAPLRGRLDANGTLYTVWEFQSTPPCGGDPGSFPPKKLGAYFNPRPLAGATIGP